MNEILWPIVASLAVGAAWYSFREWLDRMHPRKDAVPELDVQDLKGLLEAHREQVEKDLENLRGKIEMRAVSRPGMRS